MPQDRLFEPLDRNWQPVFSGGQRSSQLRPQSNPGRLFGKQGSSGRQVLGCAAKVAVPETLVDPMFQVTQLRLAPVFLKSRHEADEPGFVWKLQQRVL